MFTVFTIDKLRYDGWGGMALHHYTGGLSPTHHGWLQIGSGPSRTEAAVRKGYPKYHCQEKGAIFREGFISVFYPFFTNHIYMSYKEVMICKYPS